MLGQKLVDQLAQERWNSVDHRLNWHVCFMAQPVQSPHRGFCCKGRVSGQRLVQKYAERKQIGAMIDFSTGRLLGRHGSKGAHDGTFSGQRFTVGRFGNTEVGDLGLARAGKQDILALQVAVNDGGIMRSGHALSNLPAQFDSYGQSQFAPGQPPVQRGPLDVFHHNTVTITIMYDVVNLNHCWMI